MPWFKITYVPDCDSYPVQVEAKTKREALLRGQDIIDNAERTRWWVDPASVTASEERDPEWDDDGLWH